VPPIEFSNKIRRSGRTRDRLTFRLSGSRQHGSRYAKLKNSIGPIGNLYNNCGRRNSNTG
jgi:hypothetical protein